MGESKSPALPLGDGASVENSIAYFSNSTRAAGRFQPNFLIRAGRSPSLPGVSPIWYTCCVIYSFPVQRTAQKGARLMVHHLVIGVIFLVWGIADVLRVQLPGILAQAAGIVQRRGPPPLAEASGRAGAHRGRRTAAVLLFLRQSDRHQHHPRGDDTRRRLHPRAVLPLAEAGKREHTGMNHEEETVWGLGITKS